MLLRSLPNFPGLLPLGPAFLQAREGCGQVEFTASSFPLGEGRNVAAVAAGCWQ